MKGKLLGAIALLAVLGGGWYFASPLYAMSQLRDAARAGDAGALEQRVDFPALREDLKAELRAEIAGSGENPLGALGASIGMAIVDPLIDGFVTPQMVARLVRDGKAQAPGAAPPPPASAADEPAEAEWQVQRSGLSRFTARPVAANGEAGPELEFARDGLGWRLVGLNLPENR